MKIENYMEIKFKAISINEGFARAVVSSFALQLNPSIEELNDIKTAVSEAVTNAVVHAYPKAKGDITIKCYISCDVLYITISDEGVGIIDVDKAKEPFFTTKPDQERSGLGFAVMENFMDDLDVVSKMGEGTSVSMCKKIKQEYQEAICE